MADTPRYVRLNGELNPLDLSEQFARRQFVQVPDLLEDEAATDLARMLMQRTRFGLTWQAGDDGPHRYRHEEVARMGPQQMQEIGQKLHMAMQRDDFAFIFSQYRISAAVHEGWSETPEHEVLLAELNSPPFLEFIRQVTGTPEIRVADAQVSHYGPNQFLSVHQDVNITENENRLVAYVLNLCIGRYRPDWGGYLLIFDDQGDIIHGYRPKFNCLNLFRVPRHHAVSFVPPFSMGNRLAVTGWFRSS